MRPHVGNAKEDFNAQFLLWENDFLNIRKWISDIKNYFLISNFNIWYQKITRLINFWYQKMVMIFLYQKFMYFLISEIHVFSDIKNSCIFLYQKIDFLTSEFQIFLYQKIEFLISKNDILISEKQHLSPLWHSMLIRYWSLISQSCRPWMGHWIFVG